MSQKLTFFALIKLDLQKTGNGRLKRPTLQNFCYSNCQEAVLWIFYHCQLSLQEECFLLAIECQKI